MCVCVCVCVYVCVCVEICIVLFFSTGPWILEGRLASVCVFGVFINVNFVKIHFLNELLNLLQYPSRAKGRKKKSVTAA